MKRKDSLKDISPDPPSRMSSVLRIKKIYFSLLLVSRRKKEMTIFQTVYIVVFIIFLCPVPSQHCICNALIEHSYLYTLDHLLSVLDKTTNPVPEWQLTTINIIKV